MKRAKLFPLTPHPPYDKSVVTPFSSSALSAQVTTIQLLLPTTGPDPSALAAHFGKRTKARIQQTLREAANRLEEIPGLVRVDHGLALPSPRDVVDDSFDVGYVMLFENEQAVRDYDPHPIHREVAGNTIKPLVKKVIVYDIKH